MIRVRQVIRVEIKLDGTSRFCPLVRSLQHGVCCLIMLSVLQSNRNVELMAII